MLAPSRPERLFADDLIAGEQHDLGSYLVTGPEIVAFARQWDPLPMHTDDQASTATHFGAIIASGVHTLAVFQRLAVTAVYSQWQIIAGRTLRDVQFCAPVHADTRLHGRLTVSAITDTHPRWSRVRTCGALWSTVSNEILTVEIDSYVRRRHP
ncbi:MaoC/PaaZ C-terminal domain-containing protein [Rhodococcoides kyotonense]|uniref:MaoC-like domain-containing protein n=1 Tax=Rhodococcoides kyotonense TaxID=398843 RepID=A0A177Y6T8_9NOCA|nr:MaoC/PaaZ C-terminal domain-containing protein [Rhodococcus kyotonensis]OAK51201.1 hypothetical protein A3K89_13380 [Rhodococcus kyotonensis]